MTEKSDVVRTMSELSFFEDFPKELIEFLVPISHVESFKKDSILLKEGGHNSNLYFLTQGSVEVCVDGERVAILRQDDLIGEMSIISNKPTSATITAIEDIRVLTINVREVLDETSETSEKLQFTIHKLFSLILTEKLTMTNSKAKQFETANRDLISAQKELKEINQDLERRVEEKTRDLRSSHQELEQQNAELMASHRKMEELYNTKEITFQKLEDLFSNNLPRLRMSLEKCLSEPSHSLEEDLKMAIDHVEMVRSFLQPITALYSSEKAMKSKKVLFANSNRKQQIIAQMALGGTGVNLEIHTSPNEAPKNEKYDLVIIDAEMLDYAKKIHVQSPGTHFVLSTSERHSEYISTLKTHPFIKHFILRQDEDRTFTVKNIVTTVGKVLSQDLFGLEKYLSLAVEVKEAPVKNSDQRAQLIESMADHFKALGIRKTTFGRCEVVAEELLMNAIYDAPTDAQGKPCYNHLSRRERVSLKENECGTFRFACDGILAGISVQDPFGQLQLDTILQYFERCHQGGSGHAGDDANLKGGAGRGLHQIIENSDLVIFNVRQSAQTEVIALFVLDQKMAENFSEPAFHFFQC